MNTKTAVRYILDSKNITKYGLAMSLGAAPPSVDQWLTGTKMSKPYKDIVRDIYKVEIAD